MAEPFIRRGTKGEGGKESHLCDGRLSSSSEGISAQQGVEKCSWPLSILTGLRHSHDSSHEKLSPACWMEGMIACPGWLAKLRRGMLLQASMAE